MTGNEALKVASEFARLNHIKFLVYFSRLTCPSRHRSHIILAQIYYPFLEE